MTAAHSWQPLNLVELAANPSEPPTIGGLVYRAKRVLFSGETESLKTWLALILAKAEMDAGYAVAWADLDAMGADVETFWREVAAPLTLAGASPTLLDHVVKNAKAVGKYAYGSERKASGANEHLGFRLVEPLARGSTGRALLTTHKDRGGYLPRPTIGRLVLVSDGEHISYSLEADHTRVGSKFRPTVLMERVSRALEACSQPVSQTWVEENVKGKVPAKRTALQVLVEEGYITRDETPQGWKQHTFARPHREDDDPVLEVELDADGTPSQPRPNPVPTPSQPRPNPVPTPSPSSSRLSAIRPPSPVPLRSKDGVGCLEHTASPTASPTPSPSVPVLWSERGEATPLDDDHADAIAAALLAEEADRW